MPAEYNDKPVLVKDKKAARLIKKRAVAEYRTATNAAAVTIIEALSGKYDVEEPKENDGSDS